MTIKYPTLWIRKHEYDTLLQSLLEIEAALTKAESEWHYGAVNKQPWRQVKAVKEHLSNARVVIASLDLHGHYEFERNKSELLSRTDAACAHCGSNRQLSIDHVIPSSRGGSSEIANLQILCRPCNSSKSDRTMDEWLRSSAPRAQAAN